MMLIAGTLPTADMPLITGEVKAEGGYLRIGGQLFPAAQGTGAMLGAALSTTAYLGLPPPQAVVAGDIGRGTGSRAIYEYLIDNIVDLAPEVLALHYWLPDMAQTRRLCEAVSKCKKRPRLIADAASMYAAKAAGLAAEFDIFTPDATEIAFLADPAATHPAYVARHLFDTDITKAPELAADAYRLNSAAGLLIIKGPTDYIIDRSGIRATIDEPDVPALEAIGGTGDTITGLVAALVYGEIAPLEAGIIAVRTNRTAGQLAAADPATRVGEIIRHFPEVFRENLCRWGGVCETPGSSGR